VRVVVSGVERSVETVHVLAGCIGKHHKRSRGTSTSINKMFAPVMRDEMLVWGT